MSMIETPGGAPAAPHLFIGGPLDGEVQLCEAKPVIQVTAQMGGRTVAWAYRLTSLTFQAWKGKPVEFKAYVMEGMQSDELGAKVLGSYVRGHPGVVPHQGSEIVVAQMDPARLAAMAANLKR